MHLNRVLNYSLPASGVTRDGALTSSKMLQSPDARGQAIAKATSKRTLDRLGHMIANGSHCLTGLLAMVAAHAPEVLTDAEVGAAVEAITALTASLGIGTLPTLARQ